LKSIAEGKQNESAEILEINKNLTPAEKIRAARSHPLLSILGRIHAPVKSFLKSSALKNNNFVA
jgi:hypothetical protein